MIQIDELIQELCPNGVECKPLGEVGTVVRGKRFVKDDMVDAGIPCIHYGEIYTKYGISASQSYSFVSEERAKTLRFAQPGDVIMASAGETVEDIGKSVAWLGDDPIAIHDACYAFSGSMNPKFVSYFFASRAFRDQIRQQISSSKISSISTQNVAKARIPVPPLKVQLEVVRILDEFSELEAELRAKLESEIDARRLQHEDCRNLLLSHTPGMRKSPLGEFAEFRYGYTAKAQPVGDYRFIRITDIDASGRLTSDGAKYIETSPAADDYRVAPGDLLMARTGGTFGKTMLVRDSEPSVYASFLIRIRLDPTVMLPSYYWHFAQSRLYWDQANTLVSRGGQPQFNANVLKLVEVPIPSIEEQTRIVSILDRLDELASELTAVLSGELTGRRKQYEYYSNKLLTFKELAA